MWINWSEEKIVRKRQWIIRKNYGTGVWGEIEKVQQYINYEQAGKKCNKFAILDHLTFITHPETLDSGSKGFQKYFHIQIKRKYEYK